MNLGQLEVQVISTVLEFRVECPNASKLKIDFTSSLFNFCQAVAVDRMNRFSIWILLCLGGLIKEVELESQYVMPMSMGLKLSLPYDIANLFIRPTAGAISVLISVALLFIIFFGIITSPFGYFFGIPSRKYVLSGSPSERIEASPRFLEAEGILHKIQQLELFPLNSTSFFYWMGTENIEQDCQLMALCYAHGAFTSLPTKLLKIYSIFR